jgi:D-3-phosphoglycerate dehydrogenase
MLRVLTIDTVSALALARFPAGHYRVGAAIDQPDAALLQASSLDPSSHPPSLKVVGRIGTGAGQVDAEVLSARGIPLLHAPSANANAVKELVLAGMLMAARHMPEALSYVGTEGGEPGFEQRLRAQPLRFQGSELAGRTLGVVGLGVVGVQVANAARALGMRVLGLDPHMSVDGAWQLSAEVMRAGSINELYAGSDFVTFHVPLNEATRDLFDVGSLVHVRNGVVIINFARAGVVSSAAVREGLGNGRIGRYVTDFPEQGLVGLDGVITLPNLGAATREAAEHSAAMVIDQMRDFLENGNIRNSVNFPSLSMPRQGQARVCVANRNVPNMIGRLAQLLGSAGINIAQMRNASLGDMAYTLIDVDDDVPPAQVADIAALDGILSVRVI